MNDNILIIKEFDTITCNIDYKNDEYLTYLDKSIFAEFDKFVRENTSEDDDTVALDFFRAFSKKGVGNVIQARNYVGLVQLESGYQIQVLPKIDFIEEDKTDSITTRPSPSGRITSGASFRMRVCNGPGSRMWSEGPR